MNEYSEKERRCQASFDSEGPYWHAYTSGKQTSILFTCDAEMKLAMNIIAQAAYVFEGRIIIISMEVMNNHFHFVISGIESDIRDFFNFIKKRLSRALAGTNASASEALKSIQLCLRKIDDLQSMRNSIVYVNRNGYVADPAHTPFSYPWGTNCYFFGNPPKGRLFADINTSAARLIFHGRDPKLPGDWELIDGYVCPASYCAVGFGMAMFRDAHHYFHVISKSVESFSGVATDIEDGEFMTDPELFSEITKILNASYSCGKIRDLSDAQRLDLARILRFKYHSSNGQIRRLLGISQYQINQLFNGA